jgi:hypothetical protein
MAALQLKNPLFVACIPKDDFPFFKEQSLKEQSSFQ